MELREHFKSNKVKTVMLTLTHCCNLSCIYCYESDKNADVMDEITALQIIEQEMNGNPEIDFIEFDLFGGEPFLNFSLIKKIVEHLKSREWSKKWVCFTTTNGTLVHDEVQDWLIENREYIVCCISLDGNAVMHNANRSNSFDKIDLSFFQKMYPNQPAKMTVSPLSLPNLTEGIIYLHTKGYRVSANLAYGIDWSNEENIFIFEEQLKKLIDYYVNNPEIPICKMLDLDISLIGKKVSNEYSMKKYCGAGTTMIAYDTNGKSYPCHMFMPISTSEEKSKNSLKINFTPEYHINMLEKKCQDCIAKRVCPTCIGMNYRETGSLYTKDENYCMLMKVQLKAISLLKYYQLKNDILELDKEEKYALLQAIYAIQNEL